MQTRTGHPAELVTITTPDTLRGADPRHLDRVITSTTRLLDAVPYRGGDLDIEIGLFSLPASNLLGPYLEFLSDVATAATVAHLPTAAALILPLRKAIDRLFGSADARLELGLAHTWPEPVTATTQWSGRSHQPADSASDPAPSYTTQTAARSASHTSS